MKTDFENFHSKFIEYQRQKNFADGTIETRSNALKKFFAFLSSFPVHSVRDISKSILEQYHSFLSRQTLHVNSINSYLQSLKEFFKYLAKERYILFNPAETLILPKLLRGLPKNIPSIQDMEKILEQPNLNNLVQFRDKVIMELMYSSGIRIGEVLKINLYDIDLTDGFLLVHGKGRKERTVPVGKIACEYIKIYIEKTRPIFAKIISEKALFISAVTGRRLGFMVLEYHIKDFIKQAGYSFNVHSIRHAFATHLLQKGAQIRYIQKMLGHTQLSTTQIYTSVVQSDLKRVHAETHPEAKNTEIIRFQG